MLGWEGSSIHASDVYPVAFVVYAGFHPELVCLGPWEHIAVKEKKEQLKAGALI